MYYSPATLIWITRWMMVKIYSKPGRKNYFFEIMVDGKRAIRSTGTDKKSLAQKVADTAVAEIRAGLEYRSNLRKLIQSISNLPKNEREDAVEICRTELLKTITRSISVNDIAAIFTEKTRFHGLSVSTKRQYIYLIKEFTSWMEKEHQNIVYINDIDRSIAEGFFEYQAKKGSRSETLNKKITQMTAIFEVILHEAGLSKNVWKELKKMKGHSIGKKMFTEKQIEQLFEVVEDDLKTLFIIGSYTGLRLGDAALLKWDSIDFESNNIRIVPIKTKKSHRELGIPIHPALKATLLKLYHDEKRADSEYVIPETATTYLKSKATLSKRIRNAIIKAGIEPGYIDKSLKIKRVACLYGFHSFRHSFISIFANMGVPIHITMEIVGHNSQEVHRIYQHATEKVKQTAMDKFPTIKGTESE